MSKPNPSKVKVFGPGVEKHGLDTNTPTAEFTIDVKQAGGGKTTATVKSPEGLIECIMKNNKDGTFSCSYVPTVPGTYVVTVHFAGKLAARSPYSVNVAPGCDPTACVAYGPGVEGTELRSESPTEFWVETANAGDGKLGIAVRGPKGPIPSSKLGTKKVGDDKYHVCYTPPQPGQYSVDVTFAELHITNSPFRVRVAADMADASKCRAEGPGIQSSEVVLREQTWFDVYTVGAGRGELTVHIKSPQGTVDCQRVEKEKGVYHFMYTAVQSGEYVITIKYGDEHIPGSRFRVQVEPPTDPSKVIAYGPGLEPLGVRVGEQTSFTVKTKDAGHGEVDVKIRGPGGELPSQCEVAPYVYNYTYTASKPGNYTVDISFAGKAIPSSPFAVAITDATKVKLTGPGMDGESLAAGVPVVYKVDACGAGPGEVKCVVSDAGALQETLDHTDEGGPVVTANGDGTFKIDYTPNIPGMQKMNVTFGEAPVPDTPVRLSIFDASKVKAYGPGLEDGNKTGESTYFTIDMRKAGEGKLNVGMGGPVNTPLTIKDQANNVVRCEYTPTVAGEYVVDIQYEGIHVPNSPVHVHVKPAKDSNAVRAYGPGLEPGLTTDMWAEFFVDYRNAGDGEPHVVVNGPAGGEKVEETQEEKGLRKYRYYIDPDEAGDYKIDIDFSDEPIPKSPFLVHAAWKTDPSRVKAYGPGIEGGICGDWTEFKLDMTKAGEGGLNMQIEGPCEAVVDVDDHGDGTATVKYLPAEAGEYKINILFADEAISGSPFTPVFEPTTDATKVKAYGPGLHADGVKIGDSGDFVIDAKEAGAGAVDVVMDGPYWRGASPGPLSPSPSPGPTDPRASTKSPSGGTLKRRGAAAKPQITNNNDDTYSVCYNPQKVGAYKVNVFFADQSIPESPYAVNITDPTKVKISGPGLKPVDEQIDAAPTEVVEGVAPTQVVEGVAPLCLQDEPLEWAVDCTEAGPGELEAKVYGPDGFEEALPISQTEDDVYSAKFKPDKTGRYRMFVKYSGNEVAQSPVDLSLSDANRVKVSGSALEGGRVGDTLTLDLDSREAGEGGLSLSLSGPSQANIQCDDHQDGTATLTFTPDLAGEFKLDVKFGGEDIPGSVFSIPVIDPSKCTASGSGVTGAGARVGEPALVVVDTTESGPAPVEAELTTPSGEKCSVVLSPGEEEGIFSGEYTPDVPGNYALQVKFAGEEIPNSPFEVPICNPDAVSLKGPGLESGVVEFPNIIDVYTEGAGPGDVGCNFRCIPMNTLSAVKSLVGLPAEAEISEGVLPVEVAEGVGKPVDTQVVEIDDNHYQLYFTPHETGLVVGNVTYADLPVGKSVAVPICDPAKVKVDGAGVQAGVMVGEVAQFDVDASMAAPLECALPFEVTVANPDGDEVHVETTEFEPHKWRVNYTPETAGNYTVRVKCSDADVDGSPFCIVVCNPDAVRAYGPGLEKAVALEMTNFTVDATGAGEGSLGLQISGPAECEFKCTETSTGMYEVEYIAPRAGIYEVNLKFNDKAVPGSPFSVICDRPPPDASKCIVTGLETQGSFTVNCKDAGGNGLLEVGVSGAYVPADFISVKHNGDYTFSVSYDIPEPGETIIHVKWHGQHLAGSPFTVVTQ